MSAPRYQKKCCATSLCDIRVKIAFIVFFAFISQRKGAMIGTLRARDAYSSRPLPHRRHKHQRDLGWTAPNLDDYMPF